MYKTLGIIAHGKLDKFTKLKDELIKCPECSMDAYFGSTLFEYIENTAENRFSIECTKCDCRFLIEIT